MAVVSDIEIRLRADIARLQQDMSAARRSVDTAMNGIADVANKAKLALGGLTAGFGVQKIGQMIDEYTKFTAQLKLATNSTKEYANAYSDVKRIASAASQSLAETGTLYSRIANGTRQLGVNQKQVADITETVNLALSVSGATAQEAASAQLQLSQAFAAGALRGEEFNSVNEAAPRLMQALADGIGVPTGALRKMAEQGELTSKVLAVALPRSLGTLREEIKQVQTISGAFTVLKNNVVEFTGQTAESSNAVAVVSGALKLLADNLQIVTGAAITFGAVKLVNFLKSVSLSTYESVAANRAAALATLESAQANAMAATRASLVANAYLEEARTSTLAAVGNERLAFTTNSLIPAQARAAAAAEAQSVAMGALAVAQRGASIATTAVSGVITALGGPIGALVTVLGLAATAWSVYKSSQDEATRKAEEEVGKSTSQIIANLDKETTKLRERIALQKQSGGNDLAKDGEAGERLAEVLNRINEAKAKGNQLDEINQQGIYNTLAASISANNAAKAESDSVGQAAKDLIEVREKLTGVGKEYREELTKLQTAYEKGALSESEYVSSVKQLAIQTYNNSTAGKQYAKSLDVTEAAIRRRAEAQQFANQQDQMQVEFLKRTGQLSDAAALQKSATVDIENLKARRTELQGLLGIEQKRTDTQAKQIELSGQIKNINDQISARKIKQDQDQFELEQKLYREAVGNTADLIEAAQNESKAQKDRTRDQQDEIELIGLTEQQIAMVTAARLRDQAAALDRRAEIGIIEEVNDKLREQAEELRKQADLGLTKQRVQEQQKLWSDIEQTAHDTFVSIADGGKGAFQRLKETAKNVFFDWLYQMTLKKWIINIGASLGIGGASGVAQAAAGGSAASSAGSLLSGVGAIGSLSSGVGILGAAGLGAQAGFGALISGGFAGISAAVSGGISAIAAGTAGSIAAGMGLVAGALGPIALGIGAAYKAFSRGPKEYTGTQTLKGSLDSSGFSGMLEAEWVKKGGWLRSDKKGVDTKPVDAAVAASLGAAYDSIKKTSAEYAKVLGLNADSIANRTQALSIAMGKDEAANQKAIADFFNGVSDTIATELLPSISMFQQQGETASATFQRLAVDFDGVNKLMEKLGVDLSHSFNVTGVAAIEARERIISLAGGLDALGSQVDYYTTTFLHVVERVGPLQKQVDAQLAELGMSWVKNSKDFKFAVDFLVDSGEIATEAGAKTYTSLLKLAPTVKALDDAIQQINQMNIDSSFAGLARAVDAQKDIVTKAYNDSMTVLDAKIEGLNSTISKTSELSEALKIAMEGIDTPQAGEYSRRAAQAQITAFLAIARAGGALPAASDLRDAVSALGNDATGQFSTLAEYQRDVARTNNELAQLGGLTDGQLSLAQQQLDVLNAQKEQATAAYDAEIARLDSLNTAAQKQLDALNGIDTSIKSVDKALDVVNAALYTYAIGLGYTSANVTPLNNNSGSSFFSGILSSIYNGGVPTDNSNLASGTMSGSSASMQPVFESMEARLATMEENSAAMTRAIEQFADEFHRVSGGGNSILTEPA